MIPSFDRCGNLPPGTHTASWDELVNRFGINPERSRLLQGLEEACMALRRAGGRTLYLDGSFVTAKRIPADFDACWLLEEIDPARLEPVFKQFARGCAAQKARFSGELFPAELADGITGGSFLELFQLDRETGQPKGIIKLNLEEIP